MSENKSKLIAPLIGATVVIAGGVAAYLYFKGSIGGDAVSPLASAKLVPNNALIAGSISTDPKAWYQLQQFGTPEAQKAIAQGLQDFNKQVLDESKINYEQDIRPWLGNVMFAILPSSTTKNVQNSSKSTSAPNILLVVGIKDKISAFNFDRKLKADKKITTKDSDYKGVKISESTDQKGTTYTALLDNHLAISSDRKPVELAIDTFKGQPSFATKEGATNLLSKGVDVKNSIAQFYLPDYGNAMQQLIASNPNAAQLPAETLKQLQQVKSVVMGVGIDNDGIRMKALAKVDPTAIKLEYKPTAGKVVAQFPTDTLALISGQGISRYWSTAVEQAKTNPDTQKAFDQARKQLKSSVNLDLDKDIFGWMDGEFAIAAIPSNQGILASVGFGGAFVFKTSDHATAEATLSKLDAIAKGNSLTVAQREVQGKSVTEWQIPQQGALLGHGWLDQETVFLAVGGPVVDAIATKPTQSLDNSDTFKAVTGSLQKPNAGYFYLDMDKTMAIVNRNLAQTQPSSISPETSAILNSIRGIGMTATWPDSATSQVEMLLALKPKTAK